MMLKLENGGAEEFLFTLTISVHFNLNGLLSFHSKNGNEGKPPLQSLFFDYQMFQKLYLSEKYFPPFPCLPPLLTYIQLGKLFRI